jgi:hypothetical protein
MNAMTWQNSVFSGHTAWVWGGGRGRVRVGHLPTNEEKHIFIRLKTVSLFPCYLYYSNHIVNLPKVDHPTRSNNHWCCIIDRMNNTPLANHLARLDAGRRILRGEAILVPPKQNAAKQQACVAIPEFMSKAIRGLGVAAGLQNDVGVEEINKKDYERMSPDLKAGVLKEAELSRQRFQEAIMSMECGSEEWREFQRFLRQSGATTNIGVSMAMSCQLVDNTLNKPACDNASAFASKQLDGGGKPLAYRHRRESVPPRRLDERRHLIHQESLQSIKRRSPGALSSEGKMGSLLLHGIPSVRACKDVITSFGAKARRNTLTQQQEDMEKGEIRTGRRTSCPMATPGHDVAGDRVSSPQWRVVDRRVSSSRLIGKHHSLLSLRTPFRSYTSKTSATEESIAENNQEDDEEFTDCMVKSNSCFLLRGGEELCHINTQSGILQQQPAITTSTSHRALSSSSKTSAIEDDIEDEFTDWTRHYCSPTSAKRWASCSCKLPAPAVPRIIQTKEIRRYALKMALATRLVAVEDYSSGEEDTYA